MNKFLISFCVFLSSSFLLTTNLKAEEVIFSTIDGKEIYEVLCESCHLKPGEFLDNEIKGTYKKDPANPLEMNLNKKTFLVDHPIDLKSQLSKEQFEALFEYLSNLRGK